MSALEPVATDPSPLDAGLAAENAELKVRLQELEETLQSIRSGDVDAIVVNDEIYTLEAAHAASQRLRQDVLSQMSDAVFAFDLGGHVIYLNAAAEQRYGVSSSEVLGRARSDIFEERPVDGIDGDNAASTSIAVHRLPDGRDIDVEAITSTLADSTGMPIGSLSVVRDVTERRRAETMRSALARLSDQLRDVDDTAEIQRAAAQTLGQVLQAGHVGFGIEADAGTLSVEPTWTAPEMPGLAGPLQVAGWSRLMDSLRRGECIAIADVRLDPRSAAAVAALAGWQTRSLVNVPLLERGHLMAVLHVSHPAVRPWLADELAFVQEVVERTRVASERVRVAEALRQSEQRLREVNENLEATVASRTKALIEAEQALRQSQKMEAVGQLTGGIAHDFNNLLAGISVSLQMLQARLKQGKLDNAERYIVMGREAVQRAAALTQRLLAFARRQTLDPKPTDVNRLIAGMEELLRRTVGPSVTIEVLGAADLWATKIDPSQLENALLNLCINARDAMMPDGGRLTIATRNEMLDEAAAAERGLPAGEYVGLRVTDTGSGMRPEVVKRVFDPFFTTKPMGQGTGLGLSMVYGFVRQSGGQIQVDSTLDVGTTMWLHLPRHAGDATHDASSEHADPVHGGRGQTVLVIEDESTIRVLISEVLNEAGYHVVSASDGAAGLRELQSLGHADLLITDVGLPGGMNGRQVADAARVGLPGLKVLFITGYAESAAVGNGLLAPDMHVLTKPFDIAQLADKVHELTGR